MLIKMEKAQHGDCDLCGDHKDLTYGYVSRGATGRWCHVLWVCTSCVDPKTSISEQEARDRINELGPDDWPDF
jgi:hypothetical protein